MSVVPLLVLLGTVAATPAAPGAPAPATAAAALRQVGPAPPLPEVDPRIIRRVATALPVVALTFDACETRKMTGFDRAIINTLERERVPATLFLGGHWMWTHPGPTRELASFPDMRQPPLFELGNHSYIHPHLIRLPDSQIREEIVATQAVQFALTGRQGRWLRAPYGEYDARVLREAARLGLRMTQWDVVTGDPDPHVSAAAIIRTVARGVRPGSVIIMHMNGRGWHTAEALPGVIHLLRSRGYRFVTMSELARLG